MGVSKNSGTPKSSILIGFSIKNHPFWGPTPIFGNTQICFLLGKVVVWTDLKNRTKKLSGTSILQAESSNEIGQDSDVELLLPRGR